MNTRKCVLITIAIVILSFAIGAYYYPRYPELIASHWNAQGEVDGYMQKFLGLFLMPFMLLGLFFILFFIPRLDPLKKNIEKFRRYYNWFIVFVTLFFFYIYILTILWNTGIRFNMIHFLAPAVGVLFYYLGILMENTKRNWFIGIRTPWTLSSGNVWAKTHQVGGKLFKIAGVIAFIGIIIPDYALYVILIPVIFISVFTALYSYFEYQKEIKKKQVPQ